IYYGISYTFRLHWGCPVQDSLLLPDEAGYGRNQEENLMCGIVGYVGQEQAVPIVLDGLSRLEYRGYDSAGVAVYSQRDERLSVYKAKGRLKVLSDMLQGGAAVEGTVGVGHTRWATHGAPSDIN